MRLTSIASLLICGCFTLFAFSSFQKGDINSEGIQWMTWDEAMHANEKVQKKKFIDLYTDWCGWCKKMDKSTFQDADVIKYINENFYAIKFNAEQKEEILYNDHSFKFVANGRRGYHELAYSLLNGRMGYPSFVYLDEVSNRILISPGFKDQGQMIKELNFIGLEAFKTTTWQEYNTAN